MNNLRGAAHENEMLPWPTEEEKNRNSPWQVTWSLSYFSSGVFAFLRLDLVFNHIQTSSDFLFRTPHKRDISRLLLIFWHQDSSVNLSSFQISSVSITCFGSDMSLWTSDWNRFGKHLGWDGTVAFGESVDEVNIFSVYKCSPTYWYIVFISWLMSASHASIVCCSTALSMSQFSGIFFRFLLRAVCVLSCRAESRLINAFISGPN